MDDNNDLSFVQVSYGKNLTRGYCFERNETMPSYRRELDISIQTEHTSQIFFLAYHIVSILPFYLVLIPNSLYVLAEEFISDS